MEKKLKFYKQQYNTLRTMPDTPQDILEGWKRLILKKEQKIKVNKELEPLARKYKTFQGFLRASPLRQIDMVNGIRMYEIDPVSRLWQENKDLMNVKYTEFELKDFYKQRN